MLNDIRILKTQKVGYKLRPSGIHIVITPDINIPKKRGIFLPNVSKTTPRNILSTITTSSAYAAIVPRSFANYVVSVSS